jgi:(2Fe-2S) ferredoxin
MMVHPDGIRYKLVDEAALQQIFEQHFLRDKPVEALIYNGQPSRSVWQKRQEVGRTRSGRRRRR